MQVDDLRRSCHLVEVIDILRYYRHIVLLLKFRYEPVTLVGLHAPALLTEHVIEVRHERRVSLPSFVGSHLLYGIVLPQAVGVAEGLQTTLHRHACTSQYNNLFHRRSNGFVMQMYGKVKN